MQQKSLGIAEKSKKLFCKIQKFRNSKPNFFPLCHFLRNSVGEFFCFWSMEYEKYHGYKKFKELKRKANR